MYFDGYWQGMRIVAYILDYDMNGIPEYSLEIDCIGYDGLRQHLYTNVYKTERGAINAMRRQYPDVEWVSHD